MTDNTSPRADKPGPTDERNRFDTPALRELFRKIREFCLTLPGGNERLSHGAPSYFIDDKRSFVMYQNNHHGDGKVALWCPCPAETRPILLDTRPEIYFLPPYVGPRGWIGIRLDRDAEWREITDVIIDAYLLKAPKKYHQPVLERYRSS